MNRKRKRKKKKIKVKTITQLEIIKSIRKTWDRHPGTQVIPDKTKYNRKKKHKEQDDETHCS